MKKTTRKSGMLPEHDFSKGIRGKYAKQYKQGTNIVVLEKDVAAMVSTARENPKGVLAWAIGQRIRAAREKKIWGQEDLARESGVARANVARLETGRVVPKLPTLVRLAKALGLRTDILLKPPVSANDQENSFLAEAGIDEWNEKLIAEDKASADRGTKVKKIDWDAVAEAERFGALAISRRPKNRRAKMTKRGLTTAQLRAQRGKRIDIGKKLS